MRTSEIAERAGVNTQTLRYYERRGLLAEVEELLVLAEGGPEACGSARSLAEVHIAEFDLKIADLRRMRECLRALAATCQRPRADRSCPLLDTIAGDIPLSEVTS